MDVVIAGAHGQVARLLTRRLVAAGDRVVGLIRNPSHADDVRADGGDPVVVDLEQAAAADVAAAIEGCDAVVFAAGAGPGSGARRKETVDYGAAVTLRDAAVEAGVPRYVMVSSMGTRNPPAGDDVFSVYLRAKARADEALMASDLQWTIVRPGRLTDEPATGLVSLAERVERGDIPRDDVAAVLVQALHDDRSVGTVVELVAGDTPVADAFAGLRR
ncbi:MAG TPA: SDR family oxidoreductase [Egibacteraceae bacterium]|nr:SDR family oxidoreductase [Egibacteraceae bacterium]